MKLARTGVAAGVSPLAALNALVAAFAWVAYGLNAGLPVVWGVSVLAVIPTGWAVLLLRRETRRSDVIGVLAWIALLAIAAVAHVFGGALSVGVLVTSGPQVWRAIRHDDLSGISATTWWVAIADALSWGAYGQALGDSALRGYSATLLISALIVLSRIYWRRRAERTASGERQDLRAVLGDGDRVLGMRGE